MAILAQRLRVTTVRCILAPKYPNAKVVARIASFIHGSVSRRDVALLQRRGVTVMTASSRAAVTAIASLFLISSAFAQTTSPATTAPGAKAAPAPTRAEPPRTAASRDWSEAADSE